MTKEKLRDVLIAYTVKLYEKYTPSPLLDMGIVAKDVDDYLSTLPAETEDGGWVRVEERLPELGEDVLVCTTGGVMVLSYHTIKNSTTGQIHWLAYGEPYDVTGITHWQPLPSPPTTNNSIHLTK